MTILKALTAGRNYCVSCGPLLCLKLIDVSRRLSKSALSFQVRAGRGDPIALGIENRDVIAIVVRVVEYEFVAVIAMCAGCHSVDGTSVILCGCSSSHLFIAECASISAFSRGPVMIFPGISMPLGYMATDHCSRSIRTRTVYRMPRYFTGPVWTEIRSGAMSMVAIGGKADMPGDAQTHQTLTNCVVHRP
jgi:hypothetical protein